MEDLQESPLQSESPAQAPQAPASEPTADFGEQTLDDHLDAERKEIADLDKANGEDKSEEPEAPASDEEESEEEAEDDGVYKPNLKYKVYDEEGEFDPKLANVLTEETEPIIRALYQKAHGIDGIKESRDQATLERDEARGNFNNLREEVGRVLNYKKSGDLQSLFEAIQLDDNTLANYILEKARISQLPPEQQAVYNEREALRKRMNTLEQNFQNVQATGDNAALQARMTELDQVLLDGQTSQIAKDFDARKGQGAFRQAVIKHANAEWQTTKKDLSVKEAIASFIEDRDLSVSKGQPKPGANATKRVVARPQVKTIPNYGGRQASVTATNKPKSTDDLRKILKQMQNS